MLHPRPVLSLLAILAVAGCDRPTPPVAQAPASGVQSYEVHGILREIVPDRPAAIISHQVIPGYMEAMTMEFTLANPSELDGLTAGDAIGFRLQVDGQRGVIDQLRRISEHLDVPTPGSAPASVETLPAGLPDCPLVDQTGRSLRLHDFRGKALVVTFIFTRCPYPDFCPRLTNHFAELQRLIPAERAHLVSISIDPEYDTPARLAEYAALYGVNADVWTLATGAAEDVAGLAQQFGITIARNGALPEHNLRTVVFRADGTVARMLPGTAWTAPEAAAELLK